MEVRTTLASGAVKTFQLAEFPAEWHMPSPRTALLTTPGITEADGDYPCPTDATIRYHLQRIFHQSRRGRHVNDDNDWKEYMKKPGLYGASPVVA